MPLDSAAVMPHNNLRLPDALIVRHGPGPLLARFILAADRAARRRGISLRVRYDFEELVDLNRYYVERQLWYPLLNAFNPRHADLRRENAFWISGENENGEIVMTNACRILDWQDTNLAEQARTLWYGSDAGQPLEITAEAAWEITGTVAWGGAAWIRPDQRGKQLSYISGRTHKAFACASFPIDWSFCYIGLPNATRGLADTWGHKHLSRSIVYPGSGHPEQVVAYSSSVEFYSEIAAFMERGGVLAPEDFGATLPMGLEHIVTNTSPDGVFQGSISRS